MPKLLLLILLSVLCSHGFAQEHFITGKVLNSRLEPLSYASVRIKELQRGTTTESDGRFSLKVDEGKYDLAISLIGYKSQLITLVIMRDDSLTIIMEEDRSKTLGEVKITGIKKDRAEEIVRNVIRNKEKNSEATHSYSCDVYIKATDENRYPVKKNFQDTTKEHREVYSSMNMAEIYLSLDYESPNKIRETRKGVKVRGNSESLFYLTTTDGDFDFYKNLVHLPAISSMPMLSPISYSGLIAYKFKTLRIRKELNRTIYTIKVIPGKLGNALVSGEMDIIDSCWTLLRTHFELPKFHLVEYDYFSIDQVYEWVNNKVWMPSRQVFTYKTESGNSKLSGTTISIAQNYRFDTVFERKHFGTEVSATSIQAYQKDSTFWHTVRKEPLSGKEIRFIKYKDSISRAHSNAFYLDSIDSYNNKITLKKIFISGVDNHNWRKERFMMFGAVPELYQPFAFGGSRIGYNFYLNKIYKNRKNITVIPRLNYGFRNQDLQGSVSFSKLYNPFNRGTYFISAGREFAQVFEGDAWINQLKRSNVYVKNALEISHSVELLNGLYLHNRLEFAGRQSVANYKTGTTIDSLFPRALNNDQAISFEPYNAFYNTIGFDFTPEQKYIREPLEKIILGSNWPTFFISWRKGIPGPFNSKIDFDYLEFGIRQNLKLGLLGEANYSFISGSFLSQKDLRLVDYKFMRQGDPLLFMNPTLSFQALDSSFAIFKRFYEGHFLHQFHGSLINKIPILKKLNIMEVGGGGLLYVPERNLQYAELFFGAEKVIKFWRERFKLGGYIVTSVANRFSNPVQFKIGIEQYNKKKNSWY